MRRKILFVAVTAVALALLTFGIPLALLIRQNVTSQERSEIERLALRAAVEMTPEDVTGDPVELPHSAEAELVGLYDADGHRVQGAGPAQLEPDLASALDGSIAQATTDTSLVVAVPVSAHEEVIGIVRAASPLAEVSGQVHRDWLVLGLLGIAAAAVASAITGHGCKAAGLRFPCSASNESHRSSAKGTSVLEHPRAV